MVERPDREEALIAELWRNHFGQPLPIYGAKELARQILQEEGVTVPPLSDCGAQQNRQTGKTPPSLKQIA